MAERVQVLIVDDSSFYRKRIRRILSASPRIEVVGEAANGEDALRLTKALSPDLVTMDVAMPVMDGIAAVRHIMAEHPTPIIMFSALTRDGARSTLEALDAGAVDFLPKMGQQEQSVPAMSMLTERVLGIAAKTPVPGNTRKLSPAGRSEVSRPTPGRRQRPSHRAETRLLVIGASTGGPMAVQKVLSGLTRDFPVPVLVAIHMPGAFTSSYAERLNALTPLQVSEARQGSRLKPGQVLIAPGGLQTIVVARGGGLAVEVGEGDASAIYRPSVDRVLESAAECAGPGAIGLVMTGMGADGAAGAATLRRAGGRVWAQDRDSSVVYGMPRAIAEAGIAEHILPLERIASTLVEEI